MLFSNHLHHDRMRTAATWEKPALLLRHRNESSFPRKTGSMHNPVTGGTQKGVAVGA